MDDWLKLFDAISVREKTGVDILDSLGLKGIEVVDPVLLLTRAAWETFCNTKIGVERKRYLLVYDLFLNDARLEKEAKRLSTEYNLKIISVDASRKCTFADKNISNAGPKEFVKLIAEAEYVVTNSFHATVFSIIFNKKFSVFYKYSNISRISDILNTLGIGKQLNPNIPKYNFNWDKINYTLNEIRDNSYNFIFSTIK